MAIRWRSKRTATASICGSSTCRSTCPTRWPADYRLQGSATAFPARWRDVAIVGYGTLLLTQAWARQTSGGLRHPRVGDRSPVAQSHRRDVDTRGAGRYPLIVTLDNHYRSSARRDGRRRAGTNRRARGCRRICLRERRDTGVRLEPRRPRFSWSRCRGRSRKRSAPAGCWEPGGTRERSPETQRLRDFPSRLGPIPTSFRTGSMTPRAAARGRRLVREAFADRRSVVAHVARGGAGDVRLAVTQRRGRPTAGATGRAEAREILGRVAAAAARAGEPVATVSNRNRQALERMPAAEVTSSR